MKSSPPLQTTRTFLINKPQLTKYPKNVIKTATYNIFNFLPLALLHQFKSYFNIFFLICAILFSIPKITPVDANTSYAAFVVVQVISLIRTGIENYKKYRYDSSYNNSKSKVFDIKTKQFVDKPWKNIILGEIVKVTKDAEIPADLLIIKSSNENGYCYLQTSNLDGETNLKPREALINYHNSIVNEKDCEIYGTIEVGNPDKNIYYIEGCINTTTTSDNANATNNGEGKIYFDISNCLLRGGILKNVNYVYGIVIYTGKETKIMMNIKKGYQKLSNIDKMLNIIVLYLVIIALVLAIIMAVIGINRTSKNRNKMDYALYKNDDSGDRVLDGVRTSLAFFNIFASLIPISIMIVLEVVKVLQTIMLSFAEGYAVGDEKTKFLSLKLHENLGNIRYIFTDKTGTLTKNEMEFKGCSIFTRLYANNEHNNGNTLSMQESAFETTATTKHKSIFSRNFNVNVLRDSLLKDEYLDIDMDETPGCYYKSLSEVTLDFFMNIALNHNVLVDVEGSENNRTSYSGSNPDETVLVQAAKELDIEFVERIGNNITIKIGGGCLVHYEMLNRFDFTSERKRSSIIVRDSDGLIKLYMKGADNVILSKINTFSKQHLFTKTCEHVDKFAKDGLRTLCYSVKVLNEDEYQTFNAKFQLLQSQCLVDKNKMHELEELISQIESDMLLLGVTALEDVLQDNVKSVIKEFIEANINVWMLTGDKLDTAESIGYSCKLLMEDTEVFKIRDTDITNIEQVLMGIKSEIDEGLINSAKMLNEETPHNKVIEVVCDENDNKNVNNNNINDNINNEQAFNSERQLLKRNNTRSSSFRFKNRLSFRSKLLSRQINLSKLKNELTHTKSTASQLLDYNNNKSINNNNTKNSNIAKPVSKSHALVYIPQKQLETDEPVPSLTNSDVARSENPSNNNNNNNVSSIPFPVSNDSNMSNDVTNTNKQSITNIPQKEPNDNSIFAYMIKGDFFLDSSMKDISISFIKELKQKQTQKKSDKINLQQIKQKYKQELNDLGHKTQPLSKSPEKRNIQFSNYSLIIEGTALTECLQSKYQELFYDILSKCRSVICSRCAPFQKSQVVDFIKSHSKQMTLAIGDGGNDVNMILSADVGVGIFGKEGSQAAYSSDYAFSQFQYLRQLLFVHGRFSIWRNAYFVNFYFFKNIVYVFNQLWFTFFSFISGTIFFDNFYIMGLNSFLTTLPPCIFALFEEDIDITFKHSKNREMSKLLIPELYRSMRDNNPFSISNFLITFFAGVVISLFNFYIPLLAYNYVPTNINGEMGTLLDLSLLSFWSMIISTYLVLLTDTYNYDTWTVGLHTVQVVLLVVFPFVQNLFENYLVGGRFIDIISTGKFWLIMFVSVYGNYLLFYIARTVQRFLPGSVVSRVRMDDIANDIKKISYLKKIVEAQKYERCVTKFKKAYKKKFMEHESENYVDKKIREFVEEFKNKRLYNEEGTLFKKVKEHYKKSSSKKIQKQKSNDF